MSKLNEWIEHYDDTYRRSYFVNSNTGEFQWDFLDFENDEMHEVYDSTDIVENDNPLDSKIGNLNDVYDNQDINNANYNLKYDSDSYDIKGCQVSQQKHNIKRQFDNEQILTLEPALNSKYDYDVCSQDKNEIKQLKYEFNFEVPFDNNIYQERNYGKNTENSIEYNNEVDNGEENKCTYDIDGYNNYNYDTDQYINYETVEHADCNYQTDYYPSDKSYEYEENQHADYYYGAEHPSRYDGETDYSEQTKLLTDQTDYSDQTKLFTDQTDYSDQTKLFTDQTEQTKLLTDQTDYSDQTKLLTDQTDYSEQTKLLTDQTDYSDQTKLFTDQTDYSEQTKLFTDQNNEAEQYTDYKEQSNQYNNNEIEQQYIDKDINYNEYNYEDDNHYHPNAINNNLHNTYEYDNNNTIEDNAAGEVNLEDSEYIAREKYNNNDDSVYELELMSENCKESTTNRENFPSNYNYNHHHQQASSSLYTEETELLSSDVDDDDDSEEDEDYSIRIRYPNRSNRKDGGRISLNQSALSLSIPELSIPQQQEYDEEYDNEDNEQYEEDNDNIVEETNNYESRWAFIQSRPGGKNYDYLNMARLYRLQRPYSDPAYAGLCVLCRQRYATMVFFPCEHRCVCTTCLVRENICTDIEYEYALNNNNYATTTDNNRDKVVGDYDDDDINNNNSNTNMSSSSINTNNSGYCNCSICAAVIKLILPSEGGAEVEKYWTWVYQEQVVLPPGFRREFRHSAAIIASIYSKDGHEKLIPGSLAYAEAELDRTCNMF